MDSVGDVVGDVSDFASVLAFTISCLFARYHQGVALTVLQRVLHILGVHKPLRSASDA